MNVGVCGSFCWLPSWHEMAEKAAGALYSILDTVRVIELYGYVATQLQEMAHKVQRVFEASKELILFAGASAVVAVVNPTLFFGAMAVGIGLNFLIEGMHGPSASQPSLVVGRAYEFFIAQTTLAAVTVGCKAIHSFNVQWLLAMHREGIVSATIAGLLAGAACATVIQRVCDVAVRTMRQWT